jgi:DNA-binding NtrC family response regulator
VASFNENDPAPPLRLLLVEDSDDDAELVLRSLRQGSLRVTPHRVQAEATFRRALEENPWDLVICDFQMPGFTGMDALRIFRERGLDLPFIIVSGTRSEEIAVEVMRAGANDYLMKDRLQRLVPAIERELEQCRR